MNKIKTIRCKGPQQYAYLAGIFDGEGTFYIYHSQKRNIYRLKLYVVNTNKELIMWLKENFGGHVYSREHQIWKTRWEWHSTDKVEYILKRIIPYLIVKKENAKIALEFRKTYQRHGVNLTPELKAKRKELWRRMKELNSRSRIRVDG